MSFTPRPYQTPAIDWITRRRKGLIRGRAGCGKTLIAAAAIHKVYSSRPRREPIRIGWICNTEEQRDQAHAALEQFPMNAIIRVTCAAANPDMSDKDVLIVDECHHAAISPLWRGIIETCQGAVWGFTATPCMDDPEKHAALLELFGGQMFTVDPNQVAATLAKGRVVLLEDTDPDLRDPMDAEIERQLSIMVKKCRGVPREELWPRVAYRVCLDLGIRFNQKRNEAIVRTVERHAKDYVIVLVNNKEHGAELAERISGAVVAHSKMGKRKRTDCMRDFRAGDLHCIIATSLLDEGADLPRANILVMAAGGRSSGRVEQRSGRVLRAFQGKQEGRIYDFTDPQHPLMASQARKRQATYRELGYEIEYFREPTLFA